MRYPETKLPGSFDEIRIEKCIIIIVGDSGGDFTNPVIFFMSN